MHLGVYQPQLDRRLTRSGWTSTGPACTVRARSSSRGGPGHEDDAEEEEGRVSRGSETPLSVSDWDEFVSAQGSDEDAPLVDANEDADPSEYHFTSPLVDVVDPQADAMTRRSLRPRRRRPMGLRIMHRLRGSLKESRCHSVQPKMAPMQKMTPQLTVV